MAKPPIDEVTFAKFLGGIRLASIRVESSSCVIHDRAKLKDGKAGVVHEFGYSPQLLRATSRSAEVVVLFGVRLIREGAGGEDEEIGVLTVVYGVRYETASKMTAEIFDQFRKVTLLVNTAPFAREWIHEQSLRMGLEPILIPLAISHPAAAPTVPKKGKAE